MGRMIRRQVYLEAHQDAAVRRKAKELDATESEIIRRGVDLVTRPEFTFVPDEAAWQAELRFMEQVARKAARGQTRTWTRDEIYERGKRVSG